MPDLSKSCSLFLFVGLVYYLKQTEEVTVLITFTTLYFSNNNGISPNGHEPNLNCCYRFSLFMPFFHSNKFTYSWISTYDILYYPCHWFLLCSMGITFLICIRLDIVSRNEEIKQGKKCVTGLFVFIHTLKKKSIPITILIYIKPS